MGHSCFIYIPSLISPYSDYVVVKSKFELILSINISVHTLKDKEWSYVKIILNLFLTEEILFYNIVLILAVHQHQSADKHMSPPS